MFTHRVADYFGEIIEVEHKNNNAVEFTPTHYGELPWSTEPPLLFASREEKLEVFYGNRNARRTEPKPPYCIKSFHKRFFVIEKFKVVTHAIVTEKPGHKNAKA